MSEDQFEAVVTLKINADGDMRVEDRDGNTLQPASIGDQPELGTFVALKSMVWMKTQVNPTCHWIWDGTQWVRVCY